MPVLALHLLVVPMGAGAVAGLGLGAWVCPFANSLANIHLRTRLDYTRELTLLLL
jgi:hypothetical protein